MADVLRGALGDSEAWRWSGGGMWCSVAPVGSSRRAQGWKLHVSATPGSAAEVLARSLPVLLSGRSAFKFAASLAHVELLNARNTSRGHSGKFITVYPDSDEEAVRLARELHDATAGLPGPAFSPTALTCPGASCTIGTARSSRSAGSPMTASTYG
ncbi:hypothetical protein [Actinomadura sp. J1-007]|uniref:class III lanthionine synthetase LanKC N-terminal domain-containing protein n=1 Tax=Actinomadura sp. J1-007 TaxID=2661913 RepID=UPI00136FD769|nr:hypothetical protein [Actinomadura sp. J1-007]